MYCLPFEHGISTHLFGNVGVILLPLAQTGFRRPAKLGRLRGVRSASLTRQGVFVDFCGPAGTEFRRPAKLGRLRGVRFRLTYPTGSFFDFCGPAGTGFRRPAKLGRLRGVRLGGAGYGATPPSS